MYIAVISGILLAFSFLDYKKPQFKKESLIFLALIAILLIFRYPIGVDIPSYKGYMRGLSWGIFDEEMMRRSPLFYALLYLSAQANYNYPLFLFLINVINASIIGYTIYKNSKNIILSLFVLLTSGVSQIYMMSSLRQGLAMSAFIFGYYNYLDKDKYWQYIITLLVSFMFHETAVIGLIALIGKLLIEKVPLFKKPLTIGILVILSLAMHFAAPTLLNILYDYMGHFQMYIGDWQISYVGVALRIVLLSLVFMIYIFVDKDKKNKYTTSVYIYFLTVLLYLAFSGMSVISRMCDFYAIVEIIMIPNMVCDRGKLTSNKAKAIYYLVIGLYIAVNFVMLFDDIRFAINGLNADFNFFNYPYINIIPKIFNFTPELLI